MKPKPFSELNHFTVPVAITISLWWGSFQIRTVRMRVAVNDHPTPETPRQNKSAPGIAIIQAHKKFWVPQLQRVEPTRVRARRRGGPGPCRSSQLDQLTLTAVSSMTKEVWSLACSTPLNFRVTVCPL